jgi:deoxyribonuclease-1
LQLQNLMYFKTMIFSTISKKAPLFLISALSLLSLKTEAQAIISRQSAISFPPTNELQVNMETLMLVNQSAYPVAIDSVARFNYYGNKVFKALDSSFVILSGDSIAVDIEFSPEHNMLHSQALVFKSASGFGHFPVMVDGQGTFSKSYYSTTQNKEEQVLKSALDTKLAAGYNSLGYTTARDNMYGTLDNSGGQVSCVYTGRTATFNTRSGANTNSFNCEHTFPQGFFNSNEPMRSDIHHLFPTDVTSNSRRGNDPFGVVSSSSWSQGGSKSGGGKFEPRDAQKGATARAMMYFVIRYQDYSNHFSGQEAILRSWHDSYPPSAGEIARNNGIFALQNNRNPFVDYPQFIERISDINTTSTANANYSTYYSDDTIMLAQGTGSFDYSFVIYNRGNEDMTFRNFQLSDPNLNFGNGNPGAITLSPGDYAQIMISFDGSISYNANLQFIEEGQGSQAQTIYIQSGSQLSSAEAALQKVSFYPNPSNGHLQVQGFARLMQMSLNDAWGRYWPITLDRELDLTYLPTGIYFIRYQLKGESSYHSERLLIK